MATNKGKTAGASTAVTPPPVAKKIPNQITLHGETLSDPYAWMRNREDPDLLPHLKAENAHALSYMQDTVTLQEILFKEMRGRIKEEDSSVPYKKGRWLYYTRTLKGKQYKLHCRKLDKPGSAEQVLLDVNALAKGKKFYELGGMAISPSGNFLAYIFDDKGFRQYTLVVKNLRTGKLVSTTAERVTSVVFAADNATIFYTTEDETTKRSNKLFRHKVGSSKHHLILEEKDEFFHLDVSKSRTGNYIFLETLSHITQMVSFVESNKPKSDFQLVLPRTHGVRYEVEDDNRGWFYILTNQDAQDFRLVRAPIASASQSASWLTVVPHRPGVLLEGFDLFSEHLVVYERDNGLAKVRVQKLSTGEVHYVDFPEPAYEVSPAPNAEFVTSSVRLAYESMVTPDTVYDCDLETRQLRVLKTLPVKGYNASLYKSERIFARAEDGVMVPISLVYRSDLKLEGPRPCHLYAYGSYGFGIPARFSSLNISLLDRGFIYAIAHIRGGNEMGESWREDGKMARKMNTFNDFRACAHHLVDNGYTVSEKLTMEGASAGGLLMGAVLNLEPTLVKAAIVGVPFVDVINTMLDESLPLTVAEFEEWGNPKVEEQYRWIRQYSPYENIHAANYPAMLVTSAFWDSQVGYHEPSKYVARLRETKTDHNPLIFKIHLEPAGHGGLSGRFDKLKDVAFEFAFLLKQVGVATD